LKKRKRNQDDTKEFDTQQFDPADESKGKKKKVEEEVEP